jgi:tetratricopeptide (TPR) repeat protein
VPVDVFSREESVEFLEKRLKRKVNAKEADRLAEELGDLPLALEQAAALQLYTGISIDAYLTDLVTHARDLMALGKPTEYPVAMTAAWQMSLQQIEARLPAAGDVLRCFAFFSPEPIPHDLFRRANKTEGIAKLGPILSRPTLLTRALAELGRLALVKVDPEAGTIQVHRLIQALLRDGLNVEERKIISHEVHLLLAGGAPTDPEDVDKWSQFAELVPHVGPSGLAACEQSAPHDFVINIVRYLHRVGNYQLAREFCESFLEKWSDAFGARHRNVLRLRRELGTVLWLLGQYSASRELNEETLSLMREEFGDHDEETLRTLNVYGANLRAAGDFRSAFDQDTVSRTAHEAIFGRTSPATLLAINNLALDNALFSKYEEAARLHELVYLEGSGSSSGVAADDLLDAWNGLARVTRLRGDYEGALDLGEEAYAYGKRVLTLEHPTTLLTATDLSIARRRSGDLPGALELARETLSRLEKAFGGDNPRTMASTVSLANTLAQMNEVGEAFRLTRDIVQRYERVFGTGHPFTYGCQANLAVLYRQLGDAAKARDVNERALAGLIERLGEDHEYCFISAINLAGDLAALEELDAACALGERTLGRLRTFFGPGHALTLAGAVNLELDLRASGVNADALHKDTFAHYAKLPPTHPDRVLAESGRRIDWYFDPPPL